MKANRQQYQATPVIETVTTPNNVSRDHSLFKLSNVKPYKEKKGYNTDIINWLVFNKLILIKNVNFDFKNAELSNLHEVSYYLLPDYLVLPCKIFENHF